MLRRRWKADAIGLCLLMALAGCQATPDYRGEVDPIRGGAPIPSGMGSAAADPRANEVPPLLMGRASTSPASLAVGPTAPTSTPAVTLQVPLLPGQTVAAPGLIVPMSGPGSVNALTTAGSFSFEQIQQTLKARGVAWQQLDMTGKPDEWHFICAIPNPNDPYTRRNYETTMVGVGGLTAMRAVLVQIDHDR